MKIIKLDIDENSILAGIDAVALVEQPAIEEDFYYFSKHNENGEEVAKVFTEATIVETIIKHELFAKLYDTKEEAIIAAELLGCSGAHEMDGKWMPCSIHEEMEVEVSTLPSYDNEVSGSVIERTSFAALEEQQIVMGPLMVPNKLIKRLDENNEEYYVYFSPESVKRIAYKMMEDKLIDKVNIEHDDTDMVEDAFLVESWIVEDPNTDKATKYGFKPTEGSWYAMYKIKNDKVWKEFIKTGKVKGFSIQGFFSNYAEMMSRNVCTIAKGKECACGKSESGLCDGSHLK